VIGWQNDAGHGSCACYVDDHVCHDYDGAYRHGDVGGCGQQTVTGCDRLVTDDDVDRWHCDYEIGALQDDCAVKNGGRDSAHNNKSWFNLGHINHPHKLNCTQNTNCRHD